MSTALGITDTRAGSMLARSTVFSLLVCACLCVCVHERGSWGGEVFLLDEMSEMQVREGGRGARTIGPP